MLRACSLTLVELAERLRGVLRSEGDRGIVINGVTPLDAAAPGSIVYVTNNAGCRIAESGRCAAVLANSVQAGQVTKPVIIVDDPRAAWMACLRIFTPVLTEYRGISPDASVDPSAVIHPRAVIMQRAVIMPGARIGAGSVVWPGVFIGEQAQIGEDCVLHPNAVVREGCILGNRVIVHAGAVIGADGFGYRADADGRHLKIPQIGNVIIEDDVEIGANATIDRSTCGSTVIGEGSKIDNLVQIAHNVNIGKRNIFAAQAGIAGSSVTGEGCIFAGQAGVADHCRIGDRAVIGPQAGVQLRRVKADTVYFGTPAIEMEKMQKILPLFHRLPELLGKQNSEAAREQPTGEGAEAAGRSPDF